MREGGWMGVLGGIEMVVVMASGGECLLERGTSRGRGYGLWGWDDGRNRSQGRRLE